MAVRGVLSAPEKDDRRSLMVSCSQAIIGTQCWRGRAAFPPLTICLLFFLSASYHPFRACSAEVVAPAPAPDFGDPVEIPQVVPSVLPACIYLPDNKTFQLVQNFSSGDHLGPTDTFAPDFGKLALSGDCSTILDSSCNVVFSPGGCFDDNVSTLDECVSIRPNITSSTTSSSYTFENSTSETLSTTDTSANEYPSYTFNISIANSTEQSPDSPSSLLTTTVVTNTTTTFYQTYSVVNVTNTTTVLNTTSVYVAACSPFPRCVTASPTCVFTPVDLPPPPPLPSFSDTPPANTNFFPPGPQPHRYNVFAFGAAGDGTTDDTSAVVAAFSRACAHSQAIKEPATVYFPAQRSYLVSFMQLSGPCGAMIYFQIDGIILGPTNPSAYTDTSIPALLSFINFNGIALIGSGGVNGQADRQWWADFEAGVLDHKRPVLVEVKTCSDVIVTGITLWNPPAIHLNINLCKRVHIVGFFTDSPSDSPNTDSLHITRTDDVLVEESTLHGGDDCISIEKGSSNILIQNFWCTAGHGISIGSLGDDPGPACVSNVTVTRAVIVDNSNGVRIKTYQGGLGAVQNVTFKNVYMLNVSRPLVINQNYCDSGNGVSCKEAPEAVAISDVTFFNIVAYTNKTEGNGYYFNCSKTVPCMNIDISNVHVYASDDFQSLSPPIFENLFGAFTNVTLAGKEVGTDVVAPVVSAQMAAFINDVSSGCGASLSPGVTMKSALGATVINPLSRTRNDGGALAPLSTTSAVSPESPSSGVPPSIH